MILNKIGERCLGGLAGNKGKEKCNLKKNLKCKLNGEVDFVEKD